AVPNAACGATGRRRVRCWRWPWRRTGMTLTPERWQRLDVLLDRRLDLPPSRREDWLQAQDLPGEDRQALRRLLAAGEGAPDWLAPPRAATTPLAAGARVGPFVITGVLGRGGMGVVYAARRADTDYEQNVALKLLSAGLDSPGRRARFLVERRLLSPAWNIRASPASSTAESRATANPGTPWNGW